MRKKICASSWLNAEINILRCTVSKTSKKHTHTQAVYYDVILRRVRATIVVGEEQYRGADKSLGRSGKKQSRKHVRDAREFNNIETRAVNNFFFLQGKAPKEIHAILTETLACFLPGRAKDLSAPL